MPSAKVLSLNGQVIVDVGDGSGARVLMSDNDPLRGCYAVFSYNNAPAANATDILTIQGSASKIVRVRQIAVSGTATNATNIPLYTVRRSSAPTGGTSAPLALVARDQNDDAATASVRVYTANPAALGAAIGNADGARLNVAPAASGAIDRVQFQYGWLNDKAPVLRGVNDYLCINLGGGAVPGGCALDFNLVLTED